MLTPGWRDLGLQKRWTDAVPEPHAPRARGHRHREGAREAHAGEPEAGRVPYRDEAHKKQTAKANFLRTKGVRKPLYAVSLDLYGKEPFAANARAGGRK
jgi:hypothetical protein